MESTLFNSKEQSHILIVDDDFLVAELYMKMVQSLGYAVSAFNNSSKALAAFCEQPDLFDLVMTDLVMPGVTGLELAKRIRMLRPNLPILLCTGNPSAFSEAQLIACGISRTLFKPVRKKELARILTAFLGQPQR